MNHSIATNPELRGRLYEMFEGREWVTPERGSNVANLFNRYIDNVYNHKFMICPEGNGLDTHRLWECLYLGTIPIEKCNLNNRFYTDLPICFVDSWEEITEEFLNSEYLRIKNQVWSMGKLLFIYWKSIING